MLASRSFWLFATISMSIHAAVWVLYLTRTSIP